MQLANSAKQTHTGSTPWALNPKKVAFTLCTFFAITYTLSGQLTPSADPESEEIAELETVVVTGFQREYQQATTETAIGFSVDPQRVPLTTVTIPMDILDDQQVNNVEDALRNVSGVTKFKQGNGGEEKFSIRGFDASQSLFKDGAKINNSFNATNIATTETANIERYDVLKGPATILYGQGEPGGVINYVTKKPRFDPYYSFEGMVGSYNYYRGELDITGPIGGSESDFAYRLIASYQDSEANRDFTFRERLLIAPSLTWQMTQNTSATLQYEYITDKYTQDRGQVLDGNATTGFFFSDRQSNEQFFGYPGYNERTESDFHRLGLQFEHRFSSQAKFSLSASSTRVEKTLYDTSPLPSDFYPFLGLPPSPVSFVISPSGDVVISFRGQGGDGFSDTVLARQEFTWEQNDRVKHQFLATAGFERIKNENLVYNVNTPFFIYNVESRTYTTPPGFPTDVDFTGSRPGSQTDTHQYGFSVQDLISIDEQWHILLGGQFTSFDNRQADVTSDNFSPRVGLVYTLSPEASFYASWANGFVPTTATGFNPDTGNGVGGTPRLALLKK